MDTLISSAQLLERLCRAERQMRDRGEHARVKGMEDAITLLLRLRDATEAHGGPPPPFLEADAA